MDHIYLVSLLAENANFLYEAIAGYLTQRMGVAVTLRRDVPYGDRERMLDEGQAQIGFMCGLPYTQKRDQPVSNVELLAAPVMRELRCAGRPVYFSDIVVPRDSGFRSLADLRGATWAYNGPTSYSGYVVVQHHLKVCWGAGWEFFGRLVQSGAHQASLELVAAGRVDGTAIDSMVLALEIQQRPALADQIRVIGSIGPSPVPPVVVSRRVPAVQRQRLRALFTRMHEDDEGQAILASGLLQRFVAVRDADYDPIRRVISSLEGD